MSTSKIGELRIAIEANDADTVERILVADKELVNSGEKTLPPLYFAIWLNKPKMIEILLDHGADIENRNQDCNTTPVHYAIVYRRKDIIWLLVSRGTDLGAKKGQSTTALQVAMKGASGGFEEFDETTVTTKIQ